jgi:hypothetical protein
MMICSRHRSWAQLDMVSDVSVFDMKEGLLMATSDVAGHF